MNCSFTPNTVSTSHARSYRRLRRLLHKTNRESSLVSRSLVKRTSSIHRLPSAFRAKAPIRARSHFSFPISPLHRAQARSTIQGYTRHLSPARFGYRSWVALYPGLTTNRGQAPSCLSLQLWAEADPPRPHESCKTSVLQPQPFTQAIKPDGYHKARVLPVR